MAAPSTRRQNRPVQTGVRLVAQAQDSRYRVVTTWVPRVTACNAPQPHASTFDHAVLFNRFVSVMGAGWIIAASAAQKRRQKSLVAADQRQEDGLSR